MEKMERNLHIDDPVFDGMRTDIDKTLQRLIKNMIDKGSYDGKLTINLEITLGQEHIPNHDPNIKGETRVVISPKFSHKVVSIMQMKNEIKGDTSNDGMELVWDDELGEYVLRPVANTEQCTIFDAEFEVVHEQEPVEPETPEEIEGSSAYALPEVSSYGDEESDDFEDIDDGYGYDEPDDEE